MSVAIHAFDHPTEVKPNHIFVSQKEDYYDVTDVLLKTVGKRRYAL